MTRFSAALFDLDGTLIDTERLVIDAAIQTLAGRGHRVERSFMVSLVGIAEVEGHRRLCTHLGVDVDYQSFNADWSRAIQHAYGSGIPLMPGVGTLLDILAAQGVPRAVATNSSTKGALRKLGLAGISVHFEHVIGFDAVALPKPAPDVFLAAAAQLRVDPAQCVVFEDSDTGVAAALAAGMVVVHVPDMAPPTRFDAHHRAASILDGARACGLIA